MIYIKVYCKKSYSPGGYFISKAQPSSQQIKETTLPSAGHLSQQHLTRRMCVKWIHGLKSKHTRFMFIFPLLKIVIFSFMLFHMFDPGKRIIQLLNRLMLLFTMIT